MEKIFKEFITYTGNKRLAHVQSKIIYKNRNRNVTKMCFHTKLIEPLYQNDTKWTKKKKKTYKDLLSAVDIRYKQHYIDIKFR